MNLFPDCVTSLLIVNMVGGMLMEFLQVQFINWIRAEALKKELLAAENETLDQLLTRARSFEQVERDVRASRQ